MHLIWKTTGSFAVRNVRDDRQYSHSLTWFAFCKAMTNLGCFPQRLAEAEQSCVCWKFAKVFVGWGRTLLQNGAYRDADKRFEYQTWKEMSRADKLSKVWALGQTRFSITHRNICGKMKKSSNLSIKIFIVVSVPFHRFRVRAGNVIIFPGVGRERTRSGSPDLLGWELMKTINSSIIHRDNWKWTVTCSGFRRGAEGACYLFK